MHFIFILPLMYNLFIGSNDKVKLERFRLWQLNSSWGLVRETDDGSGHTTQGLFSSDLHFLWGYVDVKDRWNKKLLGRLYFISFLCMHVSTYVGMYSMHVCTNALIARKSKQWLIQCCFTENTICTNVPVKKITQPHNNELLRRRFLKNFVYWILTILLRDCKISK